jgi:predicted RNase H-like HicB family nuclease
MISRPYNTKAAGVVEFLVYKEGKSFVGICLTFDIIEEGDDPEKIMSLIQEAAKLHLKVVREKNLPDELLNRHAEEKYWAIYFKAMEELRKPIASPIQFLISYPYRYQCQTA